MLVKLFGMIVWLNILIGTLIKRPPSVVRWIPIATAFVLVADQLLGNSFDLMELIRIGRVEAFLMYLPAGRLARLLGGLLGSLFRPA